MVKVGVIGAGGMGNLHMGILSKMRDVEITVICDEEKEKAIEAKLKFGAQRIETNFRKLLETDEIEAILCCVPTFMHTQIVIESARAGKHIFCEKPLCMTIDEASKIKRALDKSKVKFQIGFVRRFDDEWLKFKELIIDGKIGRPVIWRSINAGSAPSAKWYVDKKKGGGPFIDGAIHNYDFANYIFGKAKEVTAFLTKFREDSTAFDTGTVIVKFESEDELMMCWSWGLPAGASGSNLHDAIGPKGAIIFQKEEFVINQGANNVELVKIEPESLTKGYVKQLQHFISCIIEDKTPEVGILEGIESLKIASAVFESSRFSKKVHI